MKNQLILFLILFTVGNQVRGQSLESVIVNLSHEGENPTGQGLIYTIGELSIDTRQSGVVLDEGFLYALDLFIMPTNEPDAALQIMIYPNPVTDQLRLRLDEAQALNYQVFDAQGRAVSSGSFDGSAHEIETQNWPSGSYFLKIQSNTNHFNTYQFQKIN